MYTNIRDRGKETVEAYRIGKYLIAADLEQDAWNLYENEISDDVPDDIEEVTVHEAVVCDDGSVMTIKEIINKELDGRQEWQRMGFPCETYRPFIIKKLE